MSCGTHTRRGKPSVAPWCFDDPHRQVSAASVTGTARHAVWLQRHRPAMAPARPDGFGRAEHVAVFCEPRRHRAGRMARQFLDRRRGLQRPRPPLLGRRGRAPSDRCPRSHRGRGPGVLRRASDFHRECPRWHRNSAIVRTVVPSCNGDIGLCLNPRETLPSKRIQHEPMQHDERGAWAASATRPTP